MRIEKLNYGTRPVTDPGQIFTFDWTHVYLTLPTKLSYTVWIVFIDWFLCVHDLTCLSPGSVP